ncbi:MAG: helix-turn-helix transcriptional regulator [Ruminococcus sp.]|nr:helix-turn-helix transcriptional regulator [Ruminococcus sp.]
MNIGKRLRNIRNHRNLTQQALGEKLGIDEKSAGVRVIQYEKGLRTPRKEYIEKLSDVLDVMPEAINIPKINDSTGLMHLLFGLEDFHDMKINKINGHICLAFDNEEINSILEEWYTQKMKLSEKEYNDWRYKFTARK